MRLLGLWRDECPGDLHLSFVHKSQRNSIGPKGQPYVSPGRSPGKSVEYVTTPQRGGPIAKHLVLYH